MPSRVLWNPINPNGDGENFKSSSSSTLTETENPSLSCNKALPRNTTDFLKAWKGLHTDADKVIYMDQLLNKQLNGDRDPSENNAHCAMENIFHEEVPIQIFPDIIHIFLTQANKKIDGTEEWKNSVSALRVLEVVSKSKRFQLTMSFLSTKDRDEICLLLKNINDNLKIDAPKNASYSQEKVLDLLEEVKNKYNILSN